MRKLASRKLWITVIGGLLLYVTSFLPADRRPPQELLYAIAAMAAAYILGEAAVDRERARGPRPPTGPAGTRPGTGG